MWRRDLRRALELSGVRAPGAAVGWTVVAVMMVVIVVMSLGFQPGGSSSGEIVVTLPREESALGPTVAPSSTVSATGAELLTVPTDGDLETGSSLSTAGPDQSAILPVVPQTLPARVESTTAPPPTVAPTTQSAAPPTTAPPATTTTVAPTTTTTVAPASTTAVPTTEPSTTSSRGSAIVVGDAYELKSGKGGKFEILDNDGDRALLDEGTLQITVAPAHADKFRVHNDHIHYESDGDYEGTDSLRYRVCTFDGACGAATVTIRLIDD